MREGQDDFERKGLAFAFYDLIDIRFYILPEAILLQKGPVIGVVIIEIRIPMPVKMIGDTHPDPGFHQAESVEGISGKELGHTVFYVGDPG